MKPYLLLLLLPFLACKKDNTATASSWRVKYEVTGTVSVPYDVIYRDPAGTVQNKPQTTAPWTYEATWSREATPEARSLSLAINPHGAASLTGKIYVDGKVVSQSSGNGVITYQLR